MTCVRPANRISNFTYAIRDIVAAATALEQQGKRIHHLNIGDPQAFGFRPPGELVEVVSEAMSKRFTGYAHSTGLLEAREAVVEYCFRQRIVIAPEDVIMTAGASEAADLVLTALLNPGDEVLLPAPGYPLYTAVVHKLGAVPRYYWLDEADGWQPSVEAIARLVTGWTRAIVLINPSNPTGAITRDSTTEKILELAERLGLLVISDEAYRELCFDESPGPASHFAQSIDTPVITLESLSKTHMVPGWRVGWMRFDNPQRMPEMITAITKLAGGRLCSPTSGQYAVAPALNGGDEFRTSFITEMRRRRDNAMDRIAGINGLSCAVPEAAFYLLIKVDLPRGVTDEDFVLDLLTTAGVLAVPGSGFGCDPSDGYFRLVFLPDMHVLEHVFDLIEQFCKLRRYGDAVPVLPRNADELAMSV